MPPSYASRRPKNAPIVWIEDSSAPRLVANLRICIRSQVTQPERVGYTFSLASKNRTWGRSAALVCQRGLAFTTGAEEREVTRIDEEAVVTQNTFVYRLKRNIINL